MLPSLFRSTLCIVVIALSSLAGCGGGGPSQSPTAVVPQDTGVAGLPWSLRPTSEAGLAVHFREALGPSGSYAGGYPYWIATPTGAPGAGTTDMLFSFSATFSGTTLQESGVDENDWIKSDGSSVFSLDRSSALSPRNLLRRQQLNAASPTLTPMGQLTVPFSSDVSGSGLYLDDDRSQLVAIGQNNGGGDLYASWFSPVAWTTSALEAVIVDTGGDAMQSRRKFRITAGLVGSRRVGSTLYIVTRSYPQLPGLKPWWEEGSTATNPPLLEALTAAQLLPTISIDGGAPQPLVQPASCLVQDSNAVKSADLVTVVAIDLASTSHPHAARCFAGGTEAFYMSVDSLYLATTRTSYGTGGTMPVYTAQSSVDLHKFALNGLSITYRGSGNVTGHLGFDQNRKSFRMGEHEGALRVITQTDMQWGGIWIGIGIAMAATPLPESPGRLSILKESAGQLVMTGQLPNANRPEPLGKPGEQLYATRFLGARGYLVTYRLTDPLYVLDLSNPADPKVAGELQVDGYSDYLFPLNENLLLGVGKDAVVTTGVGDGRFAWYQGVKVSLIDVSDPSHPVEAARAVIGRRGTDAAVLHDHHGIALLTVGGKVRIGLPVNLSDTPSEYVTGAPSDYFNFTRTELSRFEVDLAQKTLTAKAPMAASPGPWRDISNDRALLWNDQVHWYQDGSWQSGGW